MNSYKFSNERGVPTAVNWTVGDTEFSAPLSAANSDCQKFVADWAAGATVTDKDGTPQPYSDAAVLALGLTPPG